MAITAPELVTDRLELWQPQAADLASLHALTLPEETRRFLGGKQPAEMDSGHRLLRNAGSWALHGYGTFMVRRRGTPDIIGNCGVFHSWRGFGKGLDDTPEAGWIVRHDCWGQGIAHEAMTAALAWFDTAHGPRRIACMIEQGNGASERLAARLGFVPYGQHPVDGETMLVLYERLATPPR